MDGGGWSQDGNRFLIDGLSAMMMCVVTFVSLMVHIYTVGYMEEDEGYNRFFAYISLFTFSMLMLVMSNNMLQLFLDGKRLVWYPIFLSASGSTSPLRFCQYEGFLGQPCG